MTQEEIEHIAKAHGWAYNEDQMAYESDRRYMAYNNSARCEEPAWKLSDAGAFCVLVESEMLSFGHDQDPTVEPWECRWWTFDPFEEHMICAESPHQAVAEAELARLKGKFSK